LLGFNTGRRAVGVLGTVEALMEMLNEGIKIYFIDKNTYHYGTEYTEGSGREKKISLTEVTEVTEFLV